MKDQLIRQTIMTTQDDVKELKEDMKCIEEKIDEFDKDYMKVHNHILLIFTIR